MVESSPVADAALPQPFKGYELLEALDDPAGRTRTYRARDRRLDRIVALRYAAPAPEAADAAVTFFGSAAGVARVRHPRLARGLDVGHAGDYFYMAWEFVRGESLAARLAKLGRGRIAEPETLRLLAGAAEALEALYAAGLCHRGLTPASLRNHPDDGLRLAGVGWAPECFHADARAAARSRAAYAAPEQIDGAALEDIRADLYALGCIGYQALLGAPPFPAGDPDAALEGHLARVPAPPDGIDPKISPATSKLLMWLLEKDRDRRPRSPKELLAKLRRHPLAAEARLAVEPAPAPAGDAATRPFDPEDADDDGLDEPDAVAGNGAGMEEAKD